MKPQSQEICNQYSTDRGICKEDCPIKEACQHIVNDSYAVWEVRIEKAAIEYNQEKTNG